MKTILLKKIHKLGVAYKDYNRNPRRVGRKRVMDWCDHDMLQREDAEFIANFRLSLLTSERAVSDSLLVRTCGTCLV